MRPVDHEPRRPERLSAAAIVALLCAALVVAVGSWQITRSRVVALMDAKREVAVLTNALAQHAARTFEGVDLVLSGMIERIQGNPDRTTLKAFLERRASALPQVQKLEAMGADGTSAYESGGPNAPLNNADQAYFLWHRTHGDTGLHIGLAFTSRDGGVPVIPLSRRLGGTDGSFAGVVSATVPLDYFRTFYKQLKLGEHTAITLWSDTGRMLVRQPEVPPTMGRELSGSQILTQELPNTATGVFQVPASAMDGRDRIVGFQRIERHSALVTASIALEDVLAPWRQEALLQAVVLALATCALIGLATSLQRRHRRMAAVEKASDETRALFRGVFENATDLLFIQRIEPDGEIRLDACNPAAAAMLGMTPEQAKGRVPEELFTIGHAASIVRKNLARVVADAQPLRIEDSAVLGDRLKSWDVIHVPLRDAITGSITRVLVGAREITHLKLAEGRAREANRLLTMAEQVAHIGHWQIALPSRKLTWSDEVYRIYGEDPATFTPTLETAIAGYHPDDRDRFTQCVQHAIESQEAFEVEMRIVRPSGEIRHILSRGICQLSQDLNFGSNEDQLQTVFGVFADVTDLKRAERALAEKSSLLETALQNMDQGLLMVAGDGSVPVINTRALEFLRLTREQMDLRPSYRALREQLRESGSWGVSVQDPKHWHLDTERRTSEFRSERRRSDGTVIEIRSVAMQEGDGYLQTLTDVTEQRRANERIRESEARYRLLADHTSDLIVLTDEAGADTYVSPAVTTLLGYSVEEVARIGLRALVHPEDLAKAEDAQGALSAAQPSHSIIYRVQHKAGHTVWVEVALQRVEDDGRVQIIKAVRDVTLRQRQASHLEQARAAAEAGARIKAEFLANMSHELRTPLTGMLGMHDLLQSDPTLSERQRHFVGMAQDSGQALLTIVNDILDFSKIEAGQMTIEQVPFDLRELVENCRQFGAEIIRQRSLTITADIAGDVPTLFVGDPTRVRQVLLNLVTNAIKFTPHGEVAIRVTWVAQKLHLSIYDTGIGIPPEVIAHLFERFSQADGTTARRFGGTGLGLAICKRLVELMGGEIGVESTPGQGSTFWFVLPLGLADYDRRQAPRWNALTDGTTRPLRVLLAEDNRINQEILSTVLAQKHHAVTMVAEGATAVEAFGRATFDIVLMDVQMPGMDGLAATRAIRSIEQEDGRQPTPIVALTANAMAEEVELCRQAGMDAHVAKPIDWTELFSTMDRLSAPGARTARLRASTDTSLNSEGTTAYPILDGSMLDSLATLLGDERVGDLLTAFQHDVRRRLTLIGASSLTAEELGHQAHALVSSAGQLGFVELTRLCLELEQQTLEGRGLDRIATLKLVAERAIEAAFASRYVGAA